MKKFLLLSSIVFPAALTIFNNSLFASGSEIFFVLIGFAVIFSVASGFTFAFWKFQTLRSRMSAGFGFAGLILSLNFFVASIGCSLTESPRPSLATQWRAAE